MKEQIFLESKVTKIDKKIKTALKKSGITYPHHSLAFFKAVYAKVDGKTPNGNGVILAKSVKDDVPYLIGTQMNRDHLRAYNVMGSIIDAYINDNEEIEVIFSFFKTLYPNDYNEAIELMKEGKFTVSFELSVDKKDIDIVKGGYKKINHASFHGVGALFGITPAYKNAHVLTTAMQIIEDAFTQSDTSLVTASVNDIAQKWARIGELIEKSIISNNIGGTEMDNKTNEVLLDKLKASIIDEFGEEAVQDWTDKDFLSEDKIAELRETLKSSEEIKEEEVVDAEKSVSVVEVNEKTTDTYDDVDNTETIRVEKDVKVVRDGDTKIEEKSVVETVYTYAQVEEIKSELENKISEKDKEIEFLKENAKKIVELRAELGEFVKELSDEELFDETKMEIARLKKENSELKSISTVVASEEKKEEVVEEKKDDEVVEEKKDDEVVEEKKDDEVVEENKEEDENLASGHEEVEEDVIDEQASSEQRVKDLIKRRYKK